MPDPPAAFGDDADPDPFSQFAAWFDDASAVLAAPEAVALATADGGGAPSVRMVLMKHWDRRGFVVFTNYASRKARELEANPRAALLFHWDPLGRQVRVEGPVARCDPEESDAYFAVRPRGAQLAAHASRQSEPVARRADLDARVAELGLVFGDGPVPRPAWWGGYRLTPQAFEFWQNRPDRLHDRVQYLPEGDAWRRRRLQP